MQCPFLHPYFSTSLAPLLICAYAEMDASKDFHAVLMDFGSTREARVDITSRAEAVQLQEDAEAHCTAPYRYAGSSQQHAGATGRKTAGDLCDWPLQSTRAL